MTEGIAAPVGNALTVDWEDWYHGLLDRSAEWGVFPARLPEITDRMLGLFESHDVKATFFALGSAAERHPETIKRIHGAGHEIASHGYNHRFIYSQSREEFREDTKRAMGFLGDLLGEPVRGYRASTFTITEKTLWALDIIEECGFEYDSSIFPIRGSHYGIPGAPRYPYQLDGRQLWEVPLTTFRMVGRNFPVAGGFYLRVFPPWMLARAYRRINRDGNPVVLYIHPWELDPDQPREHYKGAWRFVRYWGLNRVPGRFERLLGQFDWRPVEKVLSAIRQSG